MGLFSGLKPWKVGAENKAEAIAGFGGALRISVMFNLGGGVMEDRCDDIIIIIAKEWTRVG